MLIDTHAHVNFGAFKEDAESTIQRALDEGVWVVNVGTQIDTSREAVVMADKFEKGVYAVIGIHPVHTYSQDLQEEETQFKTREEKFNYEVYKELAQNPKVVGIGECGLDYFRLPPDGAHLGIERIKKMQADSFIGQLRLAKELDKALVIHSRSAKGTDDACLDILEILKKEDVSKMRFVLHSYTGSAEVSKMFVDLGGYVSFNGILTFDKTGNQEAVLKVVPDDRILLETDCPYLTPSPHRGQRNEPAYVKHVAEKVAQIKNLSVDEVANLTAQNAKTFFKLN